eukprot:CAMPEP_0197564088 /NCGR_PEP_ID=MMETSP1320-20131121/29842_1 /TAXON_ID=91990 /ORGANISM="Bolidomonas sp., Strain RCC2347" /LENGTH=71 /DNA_ID=CAMNT_0043125977 /DNA_START=99 /DNA_END=314 /DNA_ORIENTATION=+
MSQNAKNALIALLPLWPVAALDIHVELDEGGKELGLVCEGVTLRLEKRLQEWFVGLSHRAPNSLVFEGEDS